MRRARFGSILAAVEDEETTPRLPVPEEVIGRYRLAVGVLLVFAFLLAALLGTGYRTLNTLNRLAVVEAERDLWQRPAEVLRAMGVAEGADVAEVGSGSGYFALKMSQRVGRLGSVRAVDVRWESLLVLRLRALLRSEGNLQVIHGREDDPLLPPGSLDALLIANTYHELAFPRAILRGALRALRPQGRLVVVDPWPDARDDSAGGEAHHHHHESAASAEREIRDLGYRIVLRDDRFALGPAGQAWWLIVAVRPDGPAAP